MSYWESLTESHEILAYEEGRLQGMKDIRMLAFSVAIGYPPPECVLQAIREQQEVIDEIRGEEE
tara:strand:- start:1977 stop:2168 length:192 start_codon:yes stop_codon:yes gene_type:complete